MKMKFPHLVLLFGLIILAHQAKALDTLTISQNPFPDSTHITIYNLSNDTVTLKVYNRWGNVVATFFEDSVLSGDITVTFDATALKAGIYLAFLSVNSEKDTRKLFKTQNPTGLKKIGNETNAIKIYPNPTTDLLSIFSETNIQKVELYGINGKLVLSQTKFNIQKNISLKNLDNGTYLLHIITTDNKTVVQKLVKNSP